MKFRERFLVLLFFFSLIFLLCLHLNSLLLPGLLETISDYQLEYEPLEYGPDDGLAKGLRVIMRDVWGLPSLQGVSQTDRAEFAKLYNDDRFFFGDGAEYHDILDKDTQPYKDPDLTGSRGMTLTKDEAVTLVRERIVKSPYVRSAEGLRKLFMAADIIKSQKDITSRGFKSVLRINKRIQENVGPIEKYDERFDLSHRERKVLEQALVHRVDDNIGNKNKTYKHNHLQKIPYWRLSRSNTWYKFFKEISRTHMYTESTLVDAILHGLSQLPATNFHYKSGIRFHAHIVLANKYVAEFTPIRFSRTQEARLNQRHQDDFQRHSSEIAAFHLDRALGFRRAVPTTGRTFNINSELKPAYRGEYKPSLFVTSLEGNDCILGRCKLHCQSNEIICGTPDTIESSMAVDLVYLNMTKWPNPWRSPDLVNETAEWVTDPSYCTKVRAGRPYREGRRLLDLVDLALFDFLQGNKARTEYSTISEFEDDTFIIHNDNERGFGRAFQDDPSILAPLFQCCIIRLSTLRTLMDYVSGPTKLIDVMRTSLSQDPIAPVLLKQHLLALDRRLKIALKVTYSCIIRNGYDKVVIHDGH